MSLDMANHLTGDFGVSVGNVSLVRVSGGYVDGIWQPVKAAPVPLPLVNIQKAGPREAQRLADSGRATITEDMRVVHINDGINYPRVKDDDNNYDLLTFSDGVAEREWLVVDTDNREWRNYCRVVVQRYRGQK